MKITLPGPFTMSQQAANEAYADEAELAMDLAVAVNEEVHDLFAAGADIVQIDEPWLQSRAEKARDFALPAIDRALAGAPGTTALHTCFGYAHVVHDRPSGYPFLAELADCAADVIAVEAAQPGLDPAALEPIAGKTVIAGVLDLSREDAETPEEVAARIEALLAGGPGGAAAGRPGLRDEVPLARARLAKLRALVEGARLVSRLKASLLRTTAGGRRVLSGNGTRRRLFSTPRAARCAVARAEKLAGPKRPFLPPTGGAFTARDRPPRSPKTSAGFTR